MDKQEVVYTTVVHAILQYRAPTTGAYNSVDDSQNHYAE